jgi:putative two-component system response regulator
MSRLPLAALQDAKILIVDDETANVLLLERMLQHEGFSNLRSTTDSRRVEGLFDEFQPDIILLDLHMPRLDGFGVLHRLKSRFGRQAYFPVLVLTADVTQQARNKALGSNAKDFITKPFDRSEVLLRITNLLETRLVYTKLEEQNHELEERVQERTSELEQARAEILERLALAAEYRDDDTGLHTQRVGHTAALLAKALELPVNQAKLIRRASPLHDLGKIGISDRILLKPGKLTVEEFAMMKDHTLIGARMLAGSSNLLLQLAQEIAQTHHERWDGTGYPRGLCGEGIPLSGRIVAVADVFDALSHDRPYKRAWPRGEAVAEVESQAGHQFDPVVVSAFMTLETDGKLIESGTSSLKRKHRVRYRQ